MAVEIRALPLFGSMTDRCLPWPDCAKPSNVPVVALWQQATTMLEIHTRRKARGKPDRPCGGMQKGANFSAPVRQRAWVYEG
jgi:hypothetical protein